MRPLFFLLLLFSCARLSAQRETTPADTAETAAMPLLVEVGRVAYGADSIPHIILPTLHKFPDLTFGSERERQRYTLLVANVKKLLPLARLARYTVIETHDYLETLPDKKSREEHVRRVEEGLKRQYAPTLKRLTRSQGRLLVKLIDRECNQTGYSIARAFIGSFKAGLYQTMAVLFGQSLTKRYDPEGDDRFTERVVLMVESGQL
ncbi:MAG: DUF4294 domain-containing protein [Prevotellaceae bacterium]|nr:DUF4294 domain-containing protein [Prevotellaceae bacterium]